MTTDDVVDETLTLVRIRLGLPSAENWWSQIDASSRVRWLWIDAARAEKARAVFFRQRDKEYSFTDCFPEANGPRDRPSPARSSIQTTALELEPWPDMARRMRQRRQTRGV